MTAPTTVPDLASIPTRIASITAQLSAVFVPPSADAHGASFASQLSSASSDQPTPTSTTDVVTRPG